MAFALLFLGLVPVMFLADAFLNPGEDDAPQDDAAEPAAAETDGDFFADDENGSAGDFGPTGATGPFDTLEALRPSTDDETPFDGAEVDPSDILAPVLEGETSGGDAEADPNAVLSPIDEPGEDYAGGGSELQELLSRETDFTAGIAMLGERIGATESASLSGGDDVFAEDDGLPDAGSGTLADWDGTPILADTAPVRVVDGGEGDDDITLGDTAAYGFGGDGDDTLASGPGMAALLGGAGDDTITGSATGQGLWADGGAGDDEISGGDADDILFGGAHMAAGFPDRDNISSGGGDDRIAGGFGADNLFGGAGDDEINHLGRIEEEIHWERHDFSWHIDNDPDTLDGGDGNDRLIMDRADTATGGDGADTFWVYFDGASGSGAADIQDFTVGEDFLRVTLNPQIDHGDMALNVAPSEDGMDAVVRVNGEAVAILRGAPDATTADVYVEVSDNIFVA